MQTEEKAKQRVCPRSMSLEYPHCCVGEACMAWRWTTAMIFDAPDSYRAEPPPTGYCGLAGTPDEMWDR